MFPTEKNTVLYHFKKFVDEYISEYPKKRNFDLGKEHLNVSKLSPYIRRRLVSENEIIELALSQHPLRSLDKFIQEIYWRTYWRGWLELHPKVYIEYDNANKTTDIPIKTGIKCFDYWTQELIETGYLHNHARMWYASIWIFTLNRPWEDGAKFFSEYLIDWCPASNTLGWRWVAGLQTVGKNYLATADNIKLFTNNRFNPKGQLTENHSPILSSKNLNEEVLDKISYEKIIFNKLNFDRLGLVITKNDLSLNNILDKHNKNYAKCFFYNDSNTKSEIVKVFERELCLNVTDELSDCELIENFDNLLMWAKNKKLNCLVFPYETIGTEILNNKILLSKLQNNNISYFFYLRDWDIYAFPFAKKGFFPFKKKIPDLLKLNGLL